MNYKASAARESGIQANARTGDRVGPLKLKASQVRVHLSRTGLSLPRPSLLCLGRVQSDEE